MLPLRHCRRLALLRLALSSLLFCCIGWNPVRLIMAQTAASSSSGANDLPLRTPTYSPGQYFLMIFFIEIGLFIVVSIAVKYLPTKFLTKLASRVFGFDPAQALYRKKNVEDITSPSHDSHLTSLESGTAGSSVNGSSSAVAVDDAAASMRTRILTEKMSSSDATTTTPLPSASHFPLAPLRRATSSDKPSRHGPSNTAEMMDVYLHTRPCSLWIMGREIHFDPAVLDREEVAYANRPLTVWFCLHFLNAIRGGDFLTRGCCKQRPESRNYRIRSSIRQMLLWAVYMCLVLLIAICVLGNTRYTLNPNNRSCPAEIMSSGAGSWDCWVFQNLDAFYTGHSNFVDCDYPIPDYISIDDAAIACFKLVTPTTETILQAFSTVAALFTLVFGGTTALFGWLLMHIQTKKIVYMMYTIPAAMLTAYLIVVGLNLLNTSLALLTPIVAMTLAFDMVRIRIHIGFEQNMYQDKEVQLNINVAPVPSEPSPDASSDDPSSSAAKKALPHSTAGKALSYGAMDSEVPASPSDIQLQPRSVSFARSGDEAGGVTSLPIDRLSFTIASDDHEEPRVFSVSVVEKPSMLEQQEVEVDSQQL